MPVLVYVSNMLGTCRSLVISSRQNFEKFGSTTTSNASDLAQYEFNSHQFSQSRACVATPHVHLYDVYTYSKVSNLYTPDSVLLTRQLLISANTSLRFILIFPPPYGILVFCPVLSLSYQQPLLKHYLNNHNMA